MSEYKSKKVCEHCHIAFNADKESCPKCGAIIGRRASRTKNTEGTGRMSGAGGDACGLCPVCYGSGDWCPYLD